MIYVDDSLQLSGISSVLQYFSKMIEIGQLFQHPGSCPLGATDQYRPRFTSNTQLEAKKELSALVFYSI